MKKYLVLTALALAGCGGVFGIGAEDHSDEVHVRRYVGLGGEEPPDDHLGFTYGPMQDDGFHCLINDILIADDDPRRMMNVGVHEFANVKVLDDGMPDGVTADWFLADGDTKGNAEMTPEEAAFFAAGSKVYTVFIEDEWLEAATLDAISFINTSAGREVFRAPGYDVGAWLPTPPAFTEPPICTTPPEEAAPVPVPAPVEAPQ